MNKCLECGADLSTHPTSAAAHQCSTLDRCVAAARNVGAQGFGPPNAVEAYWSEVVRAVLATAKGSCPCEWTTPCSTVCSCGCPVMSGGCRRCCKYGSDEQRLLAAEWIVAQEEALRREVIREVLQHWSFMDIPQFYEWLRIRA